ncbi:nuclear transport factor 2 family protein [Algihabitans albus]|uniref:nuclear transport factor 2 family protein n=1 Tax=Algihabitans albus TaxID=2164067 RepID=UPI000E5C9161|nr:nuclear transport factor 2 family protein [Algihabitans albus]
MKTLVAFTGALLCLAVLQSPAAAQTAGQIADELVVQRVPTEIEIAVDRKDWPRARSFFVDDIRVDFSSLSGAPPARIPADELIAAWAANLGPQKHSHHQRGHGLVTLDGDRATIYSQGYAWNRLEGNGDPLWEVWGNYTHELVRTPSGWKVTAMTFEMTHQRGNAWVRDTPAPTD